MLSSIIDYRQQLLIIILLNGLGPIRVVHHTLLSISTHGYEVLVE